MRSGEGGCYSELAGDSGRGCSLFTLSLARKEVPGLYFRKPGVPWGDRSDRG